MRIFIFDRIENMVGKGENTGYQHFLFFSCFLKGFLLRVIIYITLSQRCPGFLCVCRTTRLKTLREKVKLLVASNISFAHDVFRPIRRTVCHFHQIQNCRLQTLSVWKSLKFVVWERVKSLCGKELIKGFMTKQRMYVIVSLGDDGLEKTGFYFMDL